ncbi:ATP-dependent helicase [Candidatus Daviesbacteria bacterium]|nr:ATP-dependent helicase [Candidatus Daviesbacteria bacterium]
MQSPQFTNQYKNLNPQQKEAVDAIEGPVMVVAGPGTGKTQILTLRIANILLKTQINPENILALTFSDSAARQMRGRLISIIGTPAYRVEITTFHSFANYIIQGFPEEFENLLSSKNISEVEQIGYIEKILESNEFELIKPFGDPVYYVKKLLDSINDLKKEGIGIKKLEEALKEALKDWEATPDLYHDKGRYKQSLPSKDGKQSLPSKDGKGPMKGKYAEIKKDIEKGFELLKVYRLYEESLKKEKKYDFNDMLIEVIKVLEKNERGSSTSKRLLLLLQEKYQYFLVDEHQDTNAVQNRLIELLASFHENPNLFVVGDEKQAIFRFQGASLENFFYFKKIYPGAKLINLTQNYRSQQLILDASHSVIEKNISANVIFETVIRLKALAEKPASKIRIFESDTFLGEFSGIAQDIKNKIEEGTSPSEIAVLGRNNKDLLEIQGMLERYGIPSTLISDTDLLTDPAIQKLILLLKVVQDPLKEGNLVKAMHVNSLKIDPFDIYRCLSSAKKERVNLLNKLTSITENEALSIGVESYSNIKDFLDMLKKWQKISVNEGLEKLFVAVFEGSMIKDDVMHSSKNYETLGKINSLFEVIKEKVYQDPGFSLEDFLRFLDITIFHNLSIRGKSQIFESNTVKLMTAHKSKGLEFDFIYIILAFDGHWGNKRKQLSGFKLPWDKLGTKVQISEDENEDERRLFYVAMTRARLGVLISYSKFSLDGKEQLPSQFIQEIKSELLEKTDIRPDKKIEDLILTQFSPIKVSAKNALVIKSLFRERGLSVTAMNNFLECPWKWFFRNLLLLPDTKNLSMVFGSAVHFALNNYLKALQLGSADRKILMASLNLALNNELLSEIEKKRLLKQGEKALSAFYEAVCKNWKKGFLGETVIKGVRFSDGLILNGRIDLIEPTGNSNEVIVHDFKTGKPKGKSQIDGKNPNSKYNYFRQLTFYKLLLNNYRNGFWKVNRGVIDFVEPDEKGRIKSEIFEITEKDVTELKSQIQSIGNQILSLEFWDQTCTEKDCEWCGLRRIMGS